MKCPNCQTENNENSTLCSNCGSFLINSADTNETGVLFNTEEINKITNEKKVDINNNTKVKNNSNNRLRNIILIFISVILIVSISIFAIKYIIDNSNVDESPSVVTSEEYTESKVDVNGYKFLISSYYSYMKTDDNNYIVILSEDEGYYAYFTPLKDEYSMTSITNLKENLKNKGMVITSDQTYNNSESEYTVYTGTIYGKEIKVVYTKLDNNSLIGYIVPEEQDLFDSILTDFNDIIINTRKSSSSTSNLNILSEIPNNLENPFEE